MKARWKFVSCAVVAGALVCPALMPEARAQDTAPQAVAEIQPQAKELLDKVREALAAARTASVTIDHSFNMRGPDMNQEMQTAHELSFERPNKLAVVHKSGMMGETIIIDGESQFTHWPMLNAYAKATAPATLSEFFSKSDAESSFGSGPLGAISPLLLSQEIPEAVGTVRELRMLEPEEVNGEQLQRVRMVLAPNMNTMPEELRGPLAGKDLSMPVEYWIRSGDQPIATKLRIDLTPMMSAMMESMGENDEELGMPSMKDVEYEMVTSFKDWSLNSDIPAERFSFTAPEGAKEVKSMMEAIMAQQGAAGQMPDPGKELRGKPAPAFELAQLDGGTVALSKHKNTDIVVLDFWATWCRPCVNAMPHLIDLAKEYGDRHVVFYAINQSEDADQVRKFIEKREWKLNVLMDADGSVGAQYKVAGIPQTVIIDKDGIVQAVHVGFDKQTLKNELDALLSGKKLADATE